MGGKAGRIVCIFLPMVLTILSLIFQIMVGLGGTNSKNNYLSNIYFLEADLTAVVNNSTLTHTPATKNTPTADTDDKGNIIIENYYTISLWNYCAGDSSSGKSSGLFTSKQNKHSVDFCTKRSTHFWFNPTEVWGLNNTDSNVKLTNSYQKVLNSYSNKASRYISSLYIITIIATCVELLVSVGSVFSRLGSLFTTLSSLVTTAFSFSFAGVATATYVGLQTSSNVALQPYGIKFHIGSTIYIYMWLAVASSLASVFFWAFSACCCSGRERLGYGEKAVSAERTPYTYERVEGPYGQQSTLNTVGGRPGGYEAFRHGN